MVSQDYISEMNQLDHERKKSPPWVLCSHAREVIQQLSRTLGTEYIRDGDVAVHHSAIIEEGVIFKGPAIIGKESLVSAYSYLREGVFLGNSVKIGPHCEIKSSFIFSHSVLAHFNYVGNSLIGSHVNLEAGAVLANHFNERDNKEITVLVGGDVQKTGVTKFGALLGDYTKIGANAVTTPGTILAKYSVVPRLTRVNQLDSPQISQCSLPGIRPDTPSAIPLRPHHILDILRSYGHGRSFEPHPYGHALHTVAHQLIADSETAIQLVLGTDAICHPCRHLHTDNTCRDVLPQLSHPLSKQVYNDTLDLRLFSYLEVSPGCILSFRTFLEAVNAKLPGLEILCAHPHESVQFRLDGLQQGLQKLGVRNVSTREKPYV